MLSRGLIAAAVFSLLLPASALAATLIVREDATPLLADCAGGNELARLPKGQAVELRFALAGADNRCYSISAAVDGQALKGYVRRDHVDGLDQFEQERAELSVTQMVRSAARSIELPRAVPEPSPRYPATAPGIPPEVLAAANLLSQGQPAQAERLLANAGLPADQPVVAMVRARALLEMTRPSDAMRVIEPALRAHPKDDHLLALAGMSALQRDEVAAARKYLKQSLDIRHNPSVAQLYATVQREERSDQSHEVTQGARFALRYEGDSLPAAAAQKLSEMLDREITRVSYQIGCHLNERLAVIVQSHENYRQTTGAAEWSGGRYDGRIRIAVPPNGEVNEWVQRAFSHEFVHACLSRTGSWPAWLHEGLAQRLSGDTLQPADRDVLRQLAREDRLPGLGTLGNNWGKLNAAQAAVAYTLSLEAVQLFVRRHGDVGVRNLINGAGRLPAVTDELDRAIHEDLTRN